MNAAGVSDSIERAGDLIARSRRLVVFTGAGMSTESGIPDFRSPGGLWEKYTPVQYQEFVSSEEARVEYWRMHKELYNTVKDAKPNPAHIAIAELDKLAKLDCVITQNIDFLHQRAGVPDHKVIELHGTAKWVVCLKCSNRYDRETIQERLERGKDVPKCNACGGILKPATVSFGQAMPERETSEAIIRSKSADLFLVVGSSLVVYPAAKMPVYAVEAGAKLIIINLTRTPLDGYAEIVINAKIGEVMPLIVNAVKRRMNYSP